MPSTAAVHPDEHTEITQVRKFYTHKIKYAQFMFGEELEDILESFPEIHPFHADLCNPMTDQKEYSAQIPFIAASCSSAQRWNTCARACESYLAH